MLFRPVFTLTYSNEHNIELNLDKPYFYNIFKKKIFDKNDEEVINIISICNPVDRNDNLISNLTLNEYISKFGWFILFDSKNKYSNISAPFYVSDDNSRIIDNPPLKMYNQGCSTCYDEFDPRNWDTKNCGVLFIKNDKIFNQYINKQNEQFLFL